MKFRLLQNLLISLVVTTLGVFSINTVATFAQASEENSDRPNMQMNQNSGQMQQMMQMMQNMTPEQRQAMMGCMKQMQSGDGEQMNNNM